MPNRVDEIQGIQQSLIGAEPLMKIGTGMAAVGRKVSDAVDTYKPTTIGDTVRKWWNGPQKRTGDIKLPNRSGKVDPRLRRTGAKKPTDRTSSR